MVYGTNSQTSNLIFVQYNGRGISFYISCLSIKDVVRSSVKVPEFDKHLKKAGEHIGRNVVEITIRMKTIVRKPLMIKKTGKLILFCNLIFHLFGGEQKLNLVRRGQASSKKFEKPDQLLLVLLKLIQDV